MLKQYRVLARDGVTYFMVLATSRDVEPYAHLHLDLNHDHCYKSGRLVFSSGHAYIPHLLPVLVHNVDVSVQYEPPGKSN